MTTNTQAEKSFQQKFVDDVFHHRRENKGFTARLRRAMHPDDERKIWPFLNYHHIGTSTNARLPWLLIASAIASSKQKQNGTVSFIQALASAWPDKHNDNQHPAIIRLHRLLACTDIAELCQIVRPILSLIQSRSDEANVNYIDLLGDLTLFHDDPHRIKTLWATRFYSPSFAKKTADQTTEKPPALSKKEKRAKHLKKLNQFVDELFSRCNTDNGFAAQMRRASHPGSEQNSWQLLTRYEINIESPARLPYSLIACAIAHSKQEKNGSLPFLKALALAFPDKNNDHLATIRLRRLLACSDTTELCQIVRPLLFLIQRRVNAKLDYTGLLDELTGFYSIPHSIKTKWAKHFYFTDHAEDAQAIAGNEEQTTEDAK